MQSSLRAIVLIVGVLLLAAAVVAFGRLGFDATNAAGPAVVAVLGASVFAIGLFMPEQGLLRRTNAEDHASAGIDELDGASFPQGD